MAALTARLTPPPPRRRGRTGPLLAAAAAVLWLHAGLIQVLAPGGLRPGPVPAAAVQVRTLPAPAVPMVPAPPTDSPPHQPGPVVATAAAPATLPEPGARPPAAPRERPATGTMPRSAPDAAAHAGELSAAMAAVPLPAPAAPPATAPLAADAAGLPPAADSDAANPLQPPPLYATRLPAPVQLHYALRYNGHLGEATLTWRHDGQRYGLVLDGAGADNRPLVAQASQGGLDAHGLAPERFVDRRRQGRLQAANFRRDSGRISYSGPAVEHPAWPGAQDRLSWVAQLAGILAADAALPEVRLFVADARGVTGLWRLQPVGAETVPTPMGEAATVLWQRDPPRPEGLRVQAWVDASRGHWPVRLRFTAMRSGDVFELQLRADPTAPP